MPAHRAAIESAQAAVILSLRRLEGSLRHLFALMDGDDEAAPAVAPVAPEPAPTCPPAPAFAPPSPEETRAADDATVAALEAELGADAGRRLTRTYCGRLVSTARLAELAGCTLSAMQQRLSVGMMTPEQAVAAGPGRQYAPRKKPTPEPAPTAPPAPAPTEAPSPYGFSVFNLRPVPQHLVNTKPGLPSDLLPGQRRAP